MLAYSSSSVFQIGECDRQCQKLLRHLSGNNAPWILYVCTPQQASAHGCRETFLETILKVRADKILRIHQNYAPFHQLAKRGCQGNSSVIRRESRIFIRTFENRLSNSILESSWYMSITKTGSKIWVQETVPMEWMH